VTTSLVAVLQDLLLQLNHTSQWLQLVLTLVDLFLIQHTAAVSSL
jgi:hypothetical protein